MWRKWSWPRSRNSVSALSTYDPVQPWPHEERISEKISGSHWSTKYGWTEHSLQDRGTHFPTQQAFPGTSWGHRVLGIREEGPLLSIKILIFFLYLYYSLCKHEMMSIPDIRVALVLTLSMIVCACLCTCVYVYVLAPWTISKMWLINFLIFCLPLDTCTLRQYP